MSLQDIASAFNTEIYSDPWRPVSQEGAESPPVAREMTNGSGHGARGSSNQAEYVLGFPCDTAREASLRESTLHGVDIERSDSTRDPSEQTLERAFSDPRMSKTGIVFLTMDKGRENSGTDPDANRRDLEVDKLSPEEEELRRPPSPFLLLDGDPTRPELPSDARVIPIIKAP